MPFKTFLCATLIAATTLLSSEAWASGPEVFDDPRLEEAKRALEVQWFQPEVIATKANTGTKTIFFTGKTKSGARVQLRSQKVVKIEEDGSHRSQDLSPASLKKFPVTVDRHGLFHFEIDLPDGNFQLGTVIYDPSLGDHRAVRSYQLSFEVSDQGVELAGAKQRQEAPDLILRPKRRAALGAGANLVIYRKKSSDIPMDANFTLIEYGSLFAEYFHSFLPGSWAMNFSLKLTPGAARSTDEVTVSQGDYLWWIFAGEALYYPEQWIISTEKARVFNVGLRMGAQYHVQPFLRSFEDFSPIQEIATNQITMISGGLHTDIRWTPKWDFEAYARYQYPVFNSTAADMTLQSEFAFDGSLGAIYRWNPDSPWSAGVYWYGQWHQYKLTEFDKFSAQSVTGKQTLFFSNLEARLNYSF